MASTRNKNTRDDYALEQWSYRQGLQYPTYIHSSYGRPVESMYAGNGLVGGKIMASELCANHNDVESFLFGIDSTNLVNPRAAAVPETKTLSTLYVADRLPMLMPKPLTVEKNQREYLS